MGVKLVGKDEQPGIPAYEMADGDIGEIVASELEQNIGKIVQRNRGELIVVGRPSGQGYTIINTEHFRVRVLEPGEQLEIT